MARCVAHARFYGVLERPLRCCRYLTEKWAGRAFALDVVPEPSIDLVLVPAHAPPKPHQLVFQAETQSTASSKDAEREPSQSAALVRLPHRSACVSNFISFSIPLCVPHRLRNPICHQSVLSPTRIFALLLFSRWVSISITERTR